MIYFIQEGDDGPIKIGYSTDPKQRLRQLQTSIPRKLRMLHTIEGTQQQEFALHRKFARLRLEGEWFKPEPDLQKFIAELRAASVTGTAKPSHIQHGLTVFVGITVVCWVLGALIVWQLPAISGYWWLVAGMWAGGVPLVYSTLTHRAQLQSWAMLVLCWLISVGAPPLIENSYSWWMIDNQAALLGAIYIALGAIYWLGPWHRGGTVGRHHQSGGGHGRG